MKRAILYGILVLALAGCDQPGPQIPAEPSPVTASPVTASPVTASPKPIKPGASEPIVILVAGMMKSKGDAT